MRRVGCRAEGSDWDVGRRGQGSVQGGMQGGKVRADVGHRVQESVGQGVVKGIQGKREGRRGMGQADGCVQSAGSALWHRWQRQRRLQQRIVRFGAQVFSTAFYWKGMCCLFYPHVMFLLPMQPNAAHMHSNIPWPCLLQTYVYPSCSSSPHCLTSSRLLPHSPCAARTLHHESTIPSALRCCCPLTLTPGHHVVSLCIS